MFPLAVGTQFTYQGRIVQDGESKPHSVTFTVTDLSKMVDPGIRAQALAKQAQDPIRTAIVLQNVGNIYVAAGSLKPGSGGVTDQLIVFTMP